MEFLTGELKIFSLLLAGFWIICGIGFPLIAYFVLKDYIKNVGAWALIKLNTNYQFQNDFRMDGERCQILQIRLQHTIILNVETAEITIIRNKDFLSKEVWHKWPVNLKRIEWTEKERQEHLNKKVE